MKPVEIAIIGGLSLGGAYLAYRFIKTQPAGAAGVSVGMPAIEMPSFAIEMPTIDLSGFTEGLASLAGAITAPVAGVASTIAETVPNIVNQATAPVIEGIDAAKKAAQDAMNAGKAAMAGAYNTLKSAAVTGAQITSWVAPVVVGTYAAGGIGAGVALAGRAGWELGSRLSAWIKDIRTPATGLYEWVTRFGVIVQTRAESPLDILRAAGEKFGFKEMTSKAWLEAMLTKYKIRIMETPTKWA